MEEKKSNSRIEFWNKNKHGVEIENLKLIQFLQAQGFYKLKYSDTKYSHIHITDNIIKEVNDIYIKDYVRDYLTGINELDVLEYLLGTSHIYLSKKLLDFLTPKDISCKRDTREEAFFYFKNGFVKVTKDDIVLHPYTELDDLIWKSNIINHNISIDTFENSEFEQFLNNISSANSERLNSLQSIIGYLIHNYKDSSLTKGVIFLDEKISETGEANGGTGKSLIGRAVSLVRNTVKVDGKNFKFDKNFAFQQVSLDTNVLYFDDVKKNFDFEALYSIITDGIVVERKNQHSYSIPFDQSPKILISTNFIVNGTGGYTDDRRRIEFEFSDHYNKENSPLQEFGHRLFDDWDFNEWNKFYNTIFKITQFYLINGIVAPPIINLNNKKIIAKTSEEFLEFADSLLEELVPGKTIEFDTKKLLEEFEEKHSYELPIKTFNKWLRFWAEIREIKHEDRVSNGITYMRLTKKESTTSSPIVIPIARPLTKSQERIEVIKPIADPEISILEPDDVVMPDPDEVARLFTPDIPDGDMFMPDLDQIEDIHIPDAPEPGDD